MTERYNRGGELPPGLVEVVNTTGRNERIIPAATLDCPWPRGGHGIGCDWRLHVEIHQAKDDAT